MRQGGAKGEPTQNKALINPRGGDFQLATGRDGNLAVDTEHMR